MKNKSEAIWRLAVAVETAEREGSFERAKSLQIQFNRQLAGRVRTTIAPGEISAAPPSNKVESQGEKH